MTATDSTLVSFADLKTWAARVFERAGLPPGEAADAAAVLATANLRGVDSHGMLQMSIKVRRVLNGVMKARPNLRLEGNAPGALLADGDNGVGMVVAAWAMRQAIERARDNGTAFVAVKNSNHFGMGAYYPQMAAAAGMIGICGSNSSALMAPWGGVTPFLGTNPLTIAVPGGIEGGIVLDMATSQVAWGKLELAARAGKKIPLNWATDRDGRPTDDPNAAMIGLILPLGGYKGFGLALMIEILSMAVSGASTSAQINDFYVVDGPPEGVGHFFMAIAIERLLPLEVFKERVAQLVSDIRASQKGEGVERVYAPGEIEADTAARRLREGIPLSADVVRDLRALGEQVGEPFVA